MVGISPWYLQKPIYKNVHAISNNITSLQILYKWFFIYLFITAISSLPSSLNNHSFILTKFWLIKMKSFVGVRGITGTLT